MARWADGVMQAKQSGHHISRRCTCCRAVGRSVQRLSKAWHFSQTSCVWAWRVVWVMLGGEEADEVDENVRVRASTPRREASNSLNENTSNQIKQSGCLSSPDPLSNQWDSV